MHLFESFIWLTCLLYITNAHIAQLNDNSQFYTNSLFICKNMGIAQQNMIPYQVALLQFSTDFSTYSIVQTNNFSSQFDYPESGVITTNGESKCFLYFLQSKLNDPFSRNITLFSLDFDSLQLRSSEPATTNSPFSFSNNITLLQPDFDDIESLSTRRIFFVRNTDIMFIDQPSFSSIKYQIIPQISSLSGVIQTTSPNLIIYSYLVNSTDPIQDSSQKQQLLVYNLIMNSSDDSYSPIFYPFSLNTDHANLLGALDSCEIVQADIMEIQAFRQNLLFTISVFACKSYWVLKTNSYLARLNQTHTMIANFPNNYSIGKGFTVPIQSPECLNFLYNVRDGIKLYSNICPIYIHNAPLSEITTEGYARYLNYTKFQISLKYNSNKAVNEFTTLAIVGGNEELLQLGSQSSSNDVYCLDVTMIEYIGPIETQSDSLRTRLEGDSPATPDTPIMGQIVQVVCLTSQYGSQIYDHQFYVLNLSWSVAFFDNSLQHQYTIITFWVTIAGFLLLIGVISFRQIRIRRIAFEYIQLESLLTQYELNEEQFKEKFEILDEEVLGKGTFGVVKVCLQKPSRIALNYDKAIPTKRRAIKIINFAVNNSVIDQPSGSELDEALILVQLQKYTNAVRLVNYFSDRKTIYIVQELADSNLFTLIQSRISKKQMFSNEEIVDFCIEVGFLLNLLHNNETIAHRDLKPQNILIVDKKHYRLSDFGAAKILRIQNFYVQRTSIGSLNWMAPEMYSSCFGEYDPNRQYEMNYFKCDVFSLGLILLKMAAFIDIRGANKLVAAKDAALARMRSSRPLLHPVLADLITSMLDFDPKQRLDMAEFKTIITDTFLAATPAPNIIIPDHHSSPPTLQPILSNVRNSEPKRKLE